MSHGFEGRFHNALTSLIGARALEADDVRATALNTLADLVLESARIGERRLPNHFSELMQALLPRVAEKVRADLSRRLAHCDLLPPETARQLAGDTPEVAGPMLRQSVVLSADDLLAAAVGPSDEKARAVAGRSDLTREIAIALIARDDPVIGTALAMAPGTLDADLAECLAHIPDLPSAAAQRLVGVADLSDAALAKLFWRAGGEARWRIIERLSRRAADHDERLAPGSPGVDADRLGAALFAIASSGDRVELSAKLASFLAISSELSQRIAEDRDGEPLVVATRAIGIDVHQITGIVLLSVPEAGRSYDALRTLVGLAEGLDPRAARRVVGLWSGTRAATRATARHDPAVTRPPSRQRASSSPAPRRLEDIVADITRRTGS
jgi:uncharacterized protein (DUF2336 family)